jgi:hypothetical protein
MHNSQNPDKIGDRYCRHSDANIDLWPSGAWSNGELGVFKEIVKDSGVYSVSGQISSDTRGIALEVIMAFATGAIASGFFNKLGSDAYDYIKEKLKKLLIKDNTYSAKSNDTIGILTLEYPPSIPSFLLDKSDPSSEISMQLRYICFYRNEKELDYFLSSLDNLQKMIQTAHERMIFPFEKTECKYEISVHFGGRMNFRDTQSRWMRLIFGKQFYVTCTIRNRNGEIVKVKHALGAWFHARKCNLREWQKKFKMREKR